MTDIEAKALALVNEVERDPKYHYDCLSKMVDRSYGPFEVLCRAIEREAATEARHAAELREQAERFSEAVRYCIGQGMAGHHRETLEQFILPAPDPLVEAIKDAANPDYDCASPEAYADVLRAAIEARGGKIMWEAGE